MTRDDIKGSGERKTLSSVGDENIRLSGEDSALSSRTDPAPTDSGFPFSAGGQKYVTRVSREFSSPISVVVQRDPSSYGEKRQPSFVVGQQFPFIPTVSTQVISPNSPIVAECFVTITSSVSVSRFYVRRR